MIGSGPAGVYAAEALVEAGHAVDVLDRLPAPFGLVRYGVAPDHPKIRSVSGTLAAVLSGPGVRFIGNVDVGRDVTLAELHRHYDAVLVAVGAPVDRRLGVDGEDLAGSFSATEFVAWYCGHPDAPVDSFTLGAAAVGVVGAGNVAVDVARVLLRSADELRATHVPEHVVQVLDASRIGDVHLFVRRGPTETRISTVELRELGRVQNADVIVADPSELELPAAVEAALPGQQKRNLATLRDWAGRQPQDRPRRLTVHFHRRPAALTGDGAVDGIVVERTAADPAGRGGTTGQQDRVPVQMLLRAVGYRGAALPGLPFDRATATMPNVDGRVVADGVPVPGEYVAGWAKRGPTGVIGTNKHDARETVASLLADLPGLPVRPKTDPSALLSLLAERGVEVVSWAGWEQIELAELAAGRAAGRERATIAHRATLLAAARGATPRAAGVTQPPA